MDICTLLIFLNVTYLLFFSLINFRPGHENAGSVHVKQLYEIALAKKKDVNLQHLPEESIVRSIIGQCSSMGITVQGMDYVPEEKEAASEEGPEAVKA